jgi:hypothetical protein
MKLIKILAFALFCVTIGCAQSNTYRQKNFALRDTLYFDDLIGGAYSVPAAGVRAIADDSAGNRILFIVGGSVVLRVGTNDGIALPTPSGGTVYLSSATGAGAVFYLGGTTPSGFVATQQNDSGYTFIRFYTYTNSDRHQGQVWRSNDTMYYEKTGNVTRHFIFDDELATARDTLHQIMTFNARIDSLADSVVTLQYNTRDTTAQPAFKSILLGNRGSSSGFIGFRYLSNNYIVTLGAGVLTHDRTITIPDTTGTMVVGALSPLYQTSGGRVRADTSVLATHSFTLGLISVFTNVISDSLVAHRGRLDTLAWTAPLTYYNAFSDTATTDTVTVGGALATDQYHLQLISSGTRPSSGDILSVLPTATGFIAFRPYPATGPQAYSWTRVRKISDK